MPDTTTSPLTPWQPTLEQPWNVQRVLHLHRRAGFGANWGSIQRDLNAGPQEAIDRILHAAIDEESQEFERLSDVIGSAAVAANNIARLQAWWLFRLLRTPDPLGERLTLMWHNHFATSQTKVQDVSRMATQNKIFRDYARAKFKQLLPRVIKDPAMLVWLDADANRLEHPNENLAREIMELFTLGIEAFKANSEATDATDGYTEQDIKQAARALTGWTTNNSGFRFNANTHDAGDKAIFGQSGKWDGDRLLELLLKHPATPRRLAWRICSEFMGEGCVTDRLLADMANQLAETDLDVGQAVEALLCSQAFFTDSNIRSRVASPVEFIIGAIRSLEMDVPPPSTLLLAEWTTRMGQSLFFPPNVFGWPGGRSWLTTRTVISRANLAENLIAGNLHNPKRELDATSLAKRYGYSSWDERTSFYSQLLTGTVCADSPITAQALERYAADLARSPEAQLW